MMSNNNHKEFRLFAYLSITIVSIAVFVGIIFMLQHIKEDEKTDAVLENQKLLKGLVEDVRHQANQSLENQDLMKQLINESRAHEDREETMLGNNTSTNIKISSNNTQKLDFLIEFLTNNSYTGQ